MRIVTLILENFTAICLCVGLGIIILTNRNFDQKTNGCFAAFALITIVLIAADITEQMCALLPEPTALRYIASSLGYVLRPASIAMLVSIFLRRRKFNIALWIPIAAIGILSFTSAFTHLMFWYGRDNNFMRGPLAYSAHIVSAAYIVLLLWLTMKKHTNITSGEIFTVLFSSFICVTAAVLDTCFSECRFLLPGSMAVSCTLYYVVLYAETFKVDQLTGLLNRRSLYANAGKMKESRFSVVSVDLNGLKEINDTQGHSAGDQALKKLAEVLAADGTKEFRAYRTGGDEFIVLGREPKEETVLRYIEKVRSRLQEKGLMASLGYAFFKPGDDFDDICNQADACMYADKSQYKHRRRA